MKSQNILYNLRSLLQEEDAPDESSSLIPAQFARRCQRRRRSSPPPRSWRGTHKLTAPHNQAPQDLCLFLPLYIMALNTGELLHVE
mmetsp:Transcript_20763/g.46983  ORF Transcript_20763/g.46983 Transcript_20763/m.46983 type:complete len:86 (-) Transcript_20763:11-268(-)